ncbi:MAG: hypothetical protein DCF19_08200 [Pseudanabaena frigida]|uniref:Uncharacterized protein n=1 Tax=Pseudanabaena frigida TaxID=945775 RepID=A0A2W4Y416_9CYAN|nr:MAG: hypothetical protein DCF19_08200 [Pseudanabaena frigida]
MAQNPLIEQAKQGNVSAIASLMNRLLKSQGMLANVEREGDRLEILIESDLRSLDDEMRIPKRQVLVGMLKKWFVTLEVQTISSISISWQQTGSDEPAWTEEVFLTEPEDLDISQNGGISMEPQRPRIPPLPVLPMLERNNLSGDRTNENNPENSSPDLDTMFGEANSPESLPNFIPTTNLDDTSVNSRSSKEAELLFLSDVPSIPDSEDITNFQTETESLPSQPYWQILLKTPSLTMQFVHYCVLCVIIIAGLRGIHSVFGSSKAPKATSISIHNILL